MKVFFCDHFAFPLPEGHRFPIDKYSLLRRRVAQTGLVPPGNLLVPEAVSDGQLLRVHDADYVEKVKAGRLTEREVRRIGFPWSLRLVERSRRSVGATIAASRAALEDGFAVNLAGGTHHAHRDFGAGFCVFNDVAVACRAMQAEGRARRLVVVDCDVHQGDGTATIFAAAPSVFTFSIHGANNFPFHKARSDLDIALEDNVGDARYLEALREGLRQALDRAPADLALYLAGADPYEGDAFGRLRLSKEGLAARDRLVLEACRASGIPVATVMSGGYARQVDDTVDIHYQTVRIASELAGYMVSAPGT